MVAWSASTRPRYLATRTGWRALLSTLTLSNTSLFRAVQHAYTSDIVAAVYFSDSCPISPSRRFQNDRISSCRYSLWERIQVNDP
ncbi:hypothetical protein ARMGADRAFT_569295 [Armillaria gallica]|uniref:Uncharacterized protein n=1 Tax=Armillaria gallica TaxID=47427 RepID=A0A2H3E9Y0_ARMGA|nr:hypothetical protein ARMGADRAFT_569295 [Armillaria gallica]